MKKIFSIIFVIGCTAFIQAQDTDNSQNADNQELIEIYRNDQADRKTERVDWVLVTRRDSIREKRVYELLAAKEVRTATDYYNVAMVFQHGGDSVASGMAVKMMRKAIELDATMNKWLLAAAIDRDLMYRKKPQIYGTQFTKSSKGTWELYTIDPAQVTDTERQEYRVETIVEQQEKVKLMNSLKLSKLLDKGKTIDELIQFVRKENLKDSKYDVSERGINSFGYNLMQQGENVDALKIFKFNTELYPEEYNTYDSYGECLLAIGDKTAAIEAYTKSLELNPNNTNATKMLSSIER